MKRYFNKSISIIFLLLSCLITPQTWANSSTEKLPIVFGALVPEDHWLKFEPGNLTLSHYLSEKLKQPVQFKFYKDVAQLAQDLGSGVVSLTYGKTSTLAVLKSKNIEYVPLATVNESLDADKNNKQSQYDATVIVNKDNPVDSLNDLKKAGALNLYTNSMVSTSGIAGYVLELRKLGLNPEQDINKIINQKAYSNQIKGVAADKKGVAVVWQYTAFFPAQIKSENVKVIGSIKNIPSPMIIASPKLSEDMQKQIADVLTETKANEIQTKWISGFSKPTKEDLEYTNTVVNTIAADKYIMAVYTKDDN